MVPGIKRRVIQTALALGALLWAADLAYRLIEDISYANREQCVLFRVLPRMGFIAYEYLFETIVIVFLSVFVAVMLGRWFSRFARFFPRNPIAAFFFGSLVPVCSCAAIPLISSMEGKLKFRTTMSFVLAAPLLSPQILVLSFSVLGPRYALLRIASSFVLVMITAFLLGALRRQSETLTPAAVAGCDRSCQAASPDPYLAAYDLFKRVLPFLIAAGALGVLLEWVGPRRFLLGYTHVRGPLGILLMIGVGIPIYFCNGAEVLFLRPLMSHGFPMGTAIAVSLTSTAICLSSIAMLFRFMGRRLTVVLLGAVILITLSIALVLNAVV